MAFKVGDVVRSKSGHDAKRYYVIIALLNERYVLLADGKVRCLDHPKQKNVRHITLIEEASDSNKYVNDKSIQNKLATLSVE